MSAGSAGAKRGLAVRHGPDEPTIQPSIIKDIGRVIRRLADRGEMAIVLLEQYYDFWRRMGSGGWWPI